MKNLQIIFYIVAAAGITSAAYVPYGNQVDATARNSVPDTVAACYRNTTAYNRFTRQPMHMDNLIAIIRKIEEKTLFQWDMRRIARLLINRFQFDGMSYNPLAKEEYQFDTRSEETTKTILIKAMLPGDDQLPEGLLDNDERCALHWMLSSSLNATLRDEEIYNMRYGGNLRAKRWVTSSEEAKSHSAEDGDWDLDMSASKEAETKPEVKTQAEETKIQQAEDKTQSEEVKPESGKDKSEEVKVSSKEASTSVEVSKEIPAPQTSNVDLKPSSKEVEHDESKEESSEEKVLTTSIENTDEKLSVPAIVDPNSEVKLPQSEETKVKSGEPASETKKASEEAKALESAEKSAEKSAPVATNDNNPSKSEDAAESKEEDISNEEKPQSDESAAPKTADSKESGDAKPVEEKSSESTDEKKGSEEVAPAPSNLQSRLLNLQSDDEEMEVFDESTGEGGPFARQIAATKTKMPIETGVVYTKWGSVNAARVIAGIAAGLEPSMMSSGGFIQPSQGYNPNRSPGSGFNPSSGPDFGNNPNPGSGYNPGSSYNPNTGSYDPNPNTGSGSYNPNPIPVGSSNYGSRPQKPNWSGRKKRQTTTSVSFAPLENLFAGTVAGDIGQAAILNAKSQLTTGIFPPRGSFNNSVCPREYILEPLTNPNYDVYNPAHSWSYMTEAELRGGVDGMILGSKIRDWNAGNNMRLSELLGMYYSEQGVSGDPTYRSCDRQGIFSGIDNQGQLREQARTFAWVYNNRTNKIVFSNIDRDSSSLDRLIDDSLSAARTAITNFNRDPQCVRRPISGGGNVQIDDAMKITKPKATIYAVIDQTATKDEIWQQQLFLGQVAALLDITPQGSRIGILDGSSGQIIISPNHTDNAAMLACNIMGRDLPIRNSDDKLRVLNAFYTEVNRLRDFERNTEFYRGEGNGITLLYFIQGKKLEGSHQPEIKRVATELAGNNADVHIMYTSNKVQLNEIQDFLVEPNNDFIQLQGGNITAATTAEKFVAEFVQRSHGRLYYPRCNANNYEQTNEHVQAVDFFVSPETIQYYKISPDYFYSAKNLRLRFTSDNGKVRICYARNERFPSSRNAGANGVECKETTGSFVTPGSANVDVEFGVSKPCGKHGKRAGCTPVYISVTPTTYPQSTGGMSCGVDGCQSTNQVKVTFTHWDMRCNSGIRAMISSPVALITIFTSLFMWFKST